MQNYNNTNQSPYQLALSEMNSKNFLIDSLIADGKFHRFSRDKGRDRDSFYVCFENIFRSELPPFLNVVFGDWSEGEPWHKFNTSQSNLNREERQLLEEQIQWAIQKSKEEREKYQLPVSSDCQAKWQTLSTTGSSEYLKRKRLSDSFGARFDGENLIIPCLDEKGIIWSFQTIYPNGDKRFLKGGKKSGTFFNIGELSSADRIYVAEGYATAASIFMATNVPTVIAFDCNSLPLVAKTLKELFPTKKIDICGDDDQWKETNPGRDAALKAASAVGGRAFFPQFRNLELKPTDFNDLHCFEGLEAVRSQLSLADSEQVSDQKEDQTKRKKGNQASELIDLASGVELFHSSDDEAFATIENKGHKEVWAIESKSFKGWLAHRYFKKTGTANNSQAMTEALATLVGRARFDGKKTEVHLRLAEHQGKVYLDLCNDQWEFLEIDAEGWRKTDNDIIKFIRSTGMLSVPVPCPKKINPVTGIDKLRRFINCSSEADFRLIIGFLLSSLNPSGPFLTLVIYGEQGSGKSTLVRVLRDLIDPHKAALRSDAKTTEDLMVTAKHNYMVVADNVSHLSESLSDDLCRLATGGAITKRKLYSDDSEVTLQAKRPIILNGIDEFVVRGDLASRSIVIRLPVIEDKNREREKIFWDEFEKARPEILGALLMGVSEALKNQDTLKMDENARMADAWHWISAGESAFGWEAKSTLECFKKNQKEAFQGILDGSPIYKFIRKLIAPPPHYFKATPTETLEKLNELRDDGKEPKGWPQNARVLSNQLGRIAPQLRAAGIGIQRDRAHERYIEIWKLPDSIDTSDATTPFTAKCVEGVDYGDEKPF